MSGRWRSEPRCAPSALWILPFFAAMAAPVSKPASAAAQPEAEPIIRAQLSPLESTVLSSQLDGKIEKVHVREGERFAKGQRLVTFDCSLHQAQLAKAQALEAEAHKTAEVNQRLDSLNSISTLEVQVATARLAAARADKEITQILVNRCVIAAPFAGRVAAVNVKSHQYVPEGHQLLEILDDRQLEAEMVVPSRWLAWLAQGTAFELTIDETGRTYLAVVTRLAARIDPVSQSLVVFGKVTANDAVLLPGMSGRALFTPSGPRAR